MGGSRAKQLACRAADSWSQKKFKPHKKKRHKRDLPASLIVDRRRSNPR
jgi:hypothetical protein